MYCPNCGKELEVGSNFCRYCGHKVSGDIKAEEPALDTKQLPIEDYDDDTYLDDQDSEYNEAEKLSCIYCGSTNVYVHKKGFSGKKAAAGVLVGGVAGALAGTIGSNDIEITCLDCGRKFKPGDKEKMNEMINRAANMSTGETVFGTVVMILIGVSIIGCFVWFFSWLIG